MKERPSRFPAIVGGGEGDRHILLVSGIIKLDPSPNSTHVNVFEMAGIDPKKVEENTKLINDLINSMKE